MNIANFFDLWDILVNELFGGLWIFFFFGIITIWYIGIKARFTTEANILMSIIFTAAVFSKSASPETLILWVGIAIVVGFIFYYRYQKIIRNG